MPLHTYDSLTDALRDGWLVDGDLVNGYSLKRLTSDRDGHTYFERGQVVYERAPVVAVPDGEC